MPMVASLLLLWPVRTARETVLILNIQSQSRLSIKIFRQPQSSPSAWTRSRSQKGTPQGSAKYYSVWYRRINQSESSDSDRNEQDLAMVAQTADPTGQPLG
uniref:Secreted protein n=1 Tax=Schistocephalus solidus TaxID=70667 RepID=A0A0X3Q246_SCHSO